MAALDIIEEETRELVRRRGLDPRIDTAATRELLAAVITDYQARSAVSDLPRLADREDTGRRVLDRISGLGELQPLLDDPQIEEVWLNGPGSVFVSRLGRTELTNVVMTPPEVMAVIETMLATTGRRVDLSTPFVDASLPDGSRLHVVLPDITRTHPAVNIRKFIARSRSLEEAVASEQLTPASAGFLRAAVACGANIVVSGATQAGKTTLLNTLATAIPARERVVSCEEVFEISIPSRDWVAMQCRQPSLEGTGQVTLRSLVKEALRMRPNRIIVGEVREAESLDLLIALNAGLPGMGTIHANSARSAISKLTTLPLLAGSNISASFVVPTVATCIDVVVHCRLLPDGRRRVEEIVTLPGGIEGDVVQAETIFETRGGRLVRGRGFGHLGERMADAGFDLHAILEAA